MITYSFAIGQEEVNKTIIAKTEVFEKDATGKYVVKETREERFTIQDLEEQVAGLEAQKLAWDDQIVKLKAKITEVKKILVIE